MELYFGIPSSGNLIILDENESNHIVKVKRAQRGDTIYVTDGAGNFFTSEISSIENRKCILQIVRTEKKEENPVKIHIAIAPTKNIDRIEWFLEKATESGINEITFLRCRHSERKEVKSERIQKVLISALKQSQKYFLPKLNPIIDFEKFVSTNYTEIKLICALPASSDDSFKNRYTAGKSLLALIGPEGDFHPDEIEKAVKSGFLKTSLGSSRLRTETAAMTVCTLFNFINS